MYFFPLPHGHGSLRPARSATGARRGAAGGRGASAARRLGAGPSPSATATPPPLVAPANALAASRLGRGHAHRGGRDRRRRGRGLDAEERRTDSSSISLTSCSNILNASRLVLEQRILLAVGAQADAVLQLVELVQVVPPLSSMVNRMTWRTTSRNGSPPYIAPRGCGTPRSACVHAASSIAS